MQKTRFELSQKYLDGIERFARAHGYPPHGAHLARCIHIKSEADIEALAGDNGRGYVALLCTACADTYGVGKKTISTDSLIVFGQIG